MSQLNLLESEEKINVSIYNDTQVNKDCRGITYFSSPLIENMGNSNVAITKLRVPCSLMPVYKGPTDKLKFCLSGYSHSNHTPVVVSKSVFSSPEGLASIQTMKRQFNHALYNLFYDYCKQTYSNQGETELGFSNETFNRLYSKTIQYTNVSFPNPSSDNRLVGGVKLNIAIKNPNNQPLSDHVFEGLLEYDQDGEKSRVKLFDNVYSTTQSELNFNVSESMFNATFTGNINRSNGDMRPSESLLKLHGLNIRSDSTHKLRLIIAVKNTSPSFNYEISSSIKVASVDANLPNYSYKPILPVFPLTLSTDEQTGIVSINLQKAYRYHNIGIGFSPEIHTMLGFESYKSNGNYYLKYRPNAFDYDSNTNEPDTFNSITYHQAYSTTERFHNVSKLEVAGTSLNTLEEQNSDETTSDVITSFSPNFGGSPSIFLYDTDASIIPWRNYRLQSNTNLDKIDVAVFVRRETGEREILQISPEEYFTCSLLLVKTR